MAGKLQEDGDTIIELNHLTKVFGSGRTAVRAVDDVSLHVVKGEIVAIMGPSGSGKTTLIQIIGALLKPTSGEVIIDGKDIVDLPEKDLSRLRVNTFGFVFQSPNLFSALSAIRNVELVLNIGGVKGEKAREISRKTLTRLNLEKRLDHKPSSLSGGEQQRVAIARALANNPQIILADEPTANLDSKHGYAVTEQLRRIAKEEGRTVVMVTHDLRLRSLADRVLWLEDGKLKVRWSDGTAIDPVCLMIIDSSKTRLTSEYRGIEYYFCSARCKEKFENEPQRFEMVEV